MAIVSLYPSNKNQFRKYPIKQGGSCTSLSGEILPDSFIVNCSISSTYGNHRIFVSQIFIKLTQVDITISSVFEPGKVLGRFSGEVTQDFTTINLEPRFNYISGRLTIGTIKDMPQNELIWTFSPNALEFEESVIFCYPPPGLSSITANDRFNRTLTGSVNFGVLTNISKITVTNHIESIKKTEFTARYPEDVFNLADKSSYLDNCPNPIIMAVNGVIPSYTGDAGENSKNDGNIYFVGVEPIKFYGIPSSQPGADPQDTENGFIGVNTGAVTIAQLCTARNKLLVPLDISGVTMDEFNDKYYIKPALTEVDSINYPYTIPARAAGSFESAKKPEFYFWPQFVRQEYYAAWPPPTGATGAT
jgi:hypothetical protein